MSEPIIAWPEGFELLPPAEAAEAERMMLKVIRSLARVSECSLPYIAIFPGMRNYSVQAENPEYIQQLKISVSLSSSKGEGATFAEALKDLQSVTSIELKKRRRDELVKQVEELSKEIQQAEADA
jgi:hypothetical protein